jgi:hypothetical protein
MAGAVGGEWHGRHKEITEKKRRNDLYAVDSGFQGVVAAGAESPGFLVCLTCRVLLGALV